MPYYGWRLEDRYFLDEAIHGLTSQTDADWQLIVIDDATPLKENVAHLRSVLRKLQDRCLLITNPVTLGAGASRNIGIRAADEVGSPIILFNDSDDISHPNRLAASQKLLAEHSDVDMCYSTFTVINEASRLVPIERLAPSVRESLEAHHPNPPNGRGADVLLDVATRTGYATLTSTVAIRTNIAVANLFPVELVSEDSHTWFRYMACSRRVAFDPNIPSRYRIPENCAGSSVRTRIGERFYSEKARVEQHGFLAALDQCYRDAKLDIRSHAKNFAMFLERLALTVEREDQLGLAEEIRARIPLIMNLDKSSPANAL